MKNDLELSHLEPTLKNLIEQTLSSDDCKKHYNSFSDEEFELFHSGVKWDHVDTEESDFDNVKDLKKECKNFDHFLKLFTEESVDLSDADLLLFEHDGYIGENFFVNVLVKDEVPLALFVSED